MESLAVCHGATSRAHCMCSQVQHFHDSSQGEGTCSQRMGLTPDWIIQVGLCGLDAAWVSFRL
jgi:hypothetical protein